MKQGWNLGNEAFDQVWIEGAVLKDLQRAVDELEKYFNLRPSEGGKHGEGRGRGSSEVSV